MVILLSHFNHSLASISSVYAMLMFLPADICILVMSLASHISTDGVVCLNEDCAHPVSNVLNSDPTNYLRSDVDPQLIISVPFVSPVRLSGIKFTFREDIDPASTPSVIKLFINRPSLDFGDAEGLPPIQEISNPESGTVIPLKVALFQNVFSLQIFVQDNNGADLSEIGCLDLFGSPGENMNMREFKKIKEDD
jgi:hypothetical protein